MIELFGVELDLAPVWLTLKVAALTTVILIVIGSPIGWWLARSKSRLGVVFEAVVALPLVLPPTVLGFYLLIGLGPHGPIGSMWSLVSENNLTFSFAGLVIASVFYSLPFAVQPLMHAFESIGERRLEAAATLGASPMDRFFSVVLPLSQRGYLTAATLAFAHTVGEFGVILMIGGNIPGQTQVVSIAIYDHVEVMEYTQAHILSAGMMLFSFAVLLIVYGLNRRMEVKIG